MNRCVSWCTRTGVLLLGIGLLAGCGGRAEEAATACEMAVAERLGDELYGIDRVALAASAQEEADDVVRLQSGIVFKPGLPGEYKQQLDCKVRFGEEPDVISLTFYY